MFALCPKKRTEQIFMTSLTAYFIPSTTDCYSNKYLLNDFRIKWTTIKCSIPISSEFFSTSSPEPISTRKKFFPFIRLPKKSTTEIYVDVFIWIWCLVLQKSRKFISDFLCCGPQKSLRMNAWQNVLWLSFTNSSRAVHFVGEEFRSFLILNF